MKDKKIFLNFKKAVSVMLAVILAVSSGTVFLSKEVKAANREVVSYGREGDYSYSIYSNGSVVINEYYGNETQLVIPARAAGRAVTEVKLSYVRQDKGRITKVTVPEGVRILGYSCLNGFSGLTEVKLPSTLKKIDDYAFEGCSSLKTLRLPDSVTEMGSYVFAQCLMLDTVNIPAGMTEIPEYTFRNSSIKSIAIPGTVTRIGSGAFEDLPTLKSAALAEGIAEIGKRAFSDSGIASINIPGTVKKIGAQAFYGCSFLEKLTLAKGVGRIEEAAFYECTNLKSVTIPGSVGSIGNNAFTSCKCLKSVTVQEGVTQVGKYAFSGCSNLATVILPVSVTSIGSYILAASPAKIVCPANSYACKYAVKSGYPVKKQGNSYKKDPFPKGSTVTVGKGKYVSLGNGKAAFKAAKSKKISAITIPNTIKVGGKSYRVTQISAKAFYDCKSLKKITVKASGLKKVGSKALKGIHKKAVIKVLKSKKAYYKRLFKGRGQAKSVKIKG